MSESLIFAHFLFFGERCEWIAHFAQIKWAMWANRSGRSPKKSNQGRLAQIMSDRERITQVVYQKWANEWIAKIFLQIAHLLIFGPNTIDSLGNQMSEFPALVFSLLEENFALQTEAAIEIRIKAGWVCSHVCFASTFFISIFAIKALPWRPKNSGYSSYIDISKKDHSILSTVFTKHLCVSF